MPVNAHPDSTFSSFIHNDWTQVQTNDQIRGPSGGSGSTGSNIDLTASDKFPQNHFPVLEMPAGEGKNEESKKESKADKATEEEKKDPNEAKEEAKAAAAEPGASSVLENKPKKEKTK